MLWIGLGRVPDPLKDVPTIVIEFVSKSRATGCGIMKKRREYLAMEVPRDWIIDRFRRLMTVLRAPAEPVELTVAEQRRDTSPHSCRASTCQLARLTGGWRTLVKRPPRK